MKLAFSLILGAAMIGGVAASAHAQDNIEDKIVARLDYQAADVREVLKSLFKAVGNPGYSVDSTVQGTVTTNLTNVTFAVALQNVLRQVDATYRIEGGIYQIVRREIDTAVGGPDATTTPVVSNKVIRRIQIRFGDPQVIAILVGTDKGSQSFSVFPEMSTVQNSGGLGGNSGGGGLGGGGGGLGGGGGMGGGLGGGGGGRSGGGGGFGGGGGGRSGGGGGFGGGGGGRGF